MKTVLFMKSQNHRPVFHRISITKFHFISIFFYFDTSNRLFKSKIIFCNFLHFFFNIRIFHRKLLIIRIILIITTTILSINFVINRIFSSCKINNFTSNQFILSSSLHKNSFNNLSFSCIYIWKNPIFIISIKTVRTTFRIKSCYFQLYFITFS